MILGCEPVILHVKVAVLVLWQLSNCTVHAASYDYQQRMQLGLKGLPGILRRRQMGTADVKWQPEYAQVWV